MVIYPCWLYLAPLYHDILSFHLPLFFHLQLCLFIFVISLSLTHTRSHTHAHTQHVPLPLTCSMFFLTLLSLYPSPTPHHTIISSYPRFQRPEHSPEHHTRPPEDQCSVRCIRCFHGQDKYVRIFLNTFDNKTRDWLSDCLLVLNASHTD